MKKVLSLMMMLMLAIGAWAGESVYKTLTFSAETNSGPISSYATSWTATIDGFTWNLENFNNNNNGWNYVKCGRKNVESIGTISTASTIDQAITKVVVTVDAVTVSKINSTTLTVASDADFTTDVQTVEVAAAQGEMTYAIEAPSENCYYKLTYDCAAGSSNGLITISKVEYYMNDGGTPVVTVTPPTFSPAAGEVEVGTEVTISAPDADMIIYTIDGTDPSYEEDNGEIYTEPIVVNAAMTIKAIAVDDEGNESAVASAAYTIKPDAVTCATVSEIIALADNTEFTFTGNMVVSAYATSGNNSYLYAQDATGGMLLFKVSQAYAKGDVIPAGFSAKKTTYNGAPELTNVTGLTAATTTQELVAEEMSPGDVTLPNAFRYAIIKGASIENGYIVVEDESVIMYNRFGVTAPNDGNIYDVVGVTGWYNGAQFMPLEFKGQEVEVATPVITGETPFIGSTTVTIECETEDAAIYYTIDGSEPTNQSTAYTAPFELAESTTVKAIAYDTNNNASLVASKEFVKKVTCATVSEILALDNNTEFTFTGSMTTIAQALSANGNSKYLYAQDEEGVGMLLFNAPVDYSKGDVIPAGWAGKITQYKGAPEVTTISGMQAATETAELTAAEMTPAEVTVDPYNLFHYAVIKGVSLVDGNIVAGEESVATYCDRFGVMFPEDYEGKTFDVYGIPSWYNSAQFMPLEIVEVQQVVESTITYEAEQEGGTIAVALADGTQVESGVTKVAAGEKVTITATPAEGYKLSDIVVKCGDEVVEFDTEVTPGRAAETRTFTMPEGNVSIEATFAKETPTGIENLSMENVKSVRFYNAAGVESTTPFKGVNIVVREMTDGSKIVTKLVK
ncbi:MAG: chitobiase/beta-hexosaminidase C-terminal domain-containing protein [Muribaculaceae bacterium]|nr:chitobiase/beta-hexosaminidase C-terminal domain-containing protein [Muribaculaceae bacterium]